MELTDDDASIILERLPSIDALPGFLAEIANSMELSSRSKIFGTSAALQLLTQRVLATDSLFDEHPISLFTRLPPRTHLVTFGFIPLGPQIKREEDVRTKYISSENFVFGVSVLADLRVPQAVQIIIGEVEFGERQFPVVLTNSKLRTNGTPPHIGQPSKLGSAACWVKSTNQNSGWVHGILTARHVTELLSEGDNINLDPNTAHKLPSIGSLEDEGDCPIDASIVGIDPVDWPSNLSPLAMPGPFTKPLAANDLVDLVGRYTQASCKIVSHHPLPGYWGSMMGQRLVLDGYGQGGDSGGLVTLDATGDPVGIYIGRVDDGNGGEQGLCQDFYQASQYLEFEPYL